MYIKSYSLNTQEMWAYNKHSLCAPPPLFLERGFPFSLESSYSPAFFFSDRSSNPSCLPPFLYAFWWSSSLINPPSWFLVGFLFRRCSSVDLGSLGDLRQPRPAWTALTLIGACFCTCPEPMRWCVRSHACMWISHPYSSFQI